MRRYRITALFAVLALCLSAGSCKGERVDLSQREQTEITLSWWGNDTRTEYTLKGVREFERLHPEIKVKCYYSEWSGYEVRSRIRMISDTEADVMQINVGWLSEFSADGSGYYDLNNVSGMIDLSKFPDDTLKYGVRNGVQNAVPIAMNAETVYFNKTIYESYGLNIPKTWDDIFNAAKVMSKDGIYPLAGVAKSMWLYSLAYTEQLTGKSFFTPEGKLGFGENEMRTMIEFYVRMVNEKVIPKIEDFTKVGMENHIYAGAVAWVSDAESYCGKAAEQGDSLIAADYTAFSSDRSGEGWYEKPATLYAVSKNTEHPVESAMLLDFLLNSKEMAMLQGVEKGIPISTAALSYLEEADLLKGIQFEASEVMANNSRLKEMDSRMENTDIINAFIDACDLVLYDKASSEDAAKGFAKTCAEAFG